MKKLIYSAVLAVALLLTSCQNNQSLQQYYVSNADNPSFISVDVPASILNLQEADLSEDQQEALASLKKFNVLAFRITDENAVEYEAEKAKVSSILKSSKFNELMKLNSKYGKGVIKYLGDEDAIDEVVIYGSSDEKGFALIRVLGDDMNPAHIVKLVQAMQKSDYDTEALGELNELFKI